MIPLYLVRVVPQLLLTTSLVARRGEEGRRGVLWIMRG